MTNKRYGLGNYITAAQINKWELFGIGRYCDELVPANIPAADFYLYSQQAILTIYLVVVLDYMSQDLPRM